MDFDRALADRIIRSVAEIRAGDLAFCVPRGRYSLDILTEKKNDGGDACTKAIVEPDAAQADGG